MSLINFVKGYGSDHTVHVSHPSRKAHPGKFHLFQYILSDRKKTLQLPYFRTDLGGLMKGYASNHNPSDSRLARPSLAAFASKIACPYLGVFYVKQPSSKEGFSKNHGFGTILTPIYGSCLIDNLYHPH